MWLRRARRAFGRDPSLNDLTVACTTLAAAGRGQSSAGQQHSDSLADTAMDARRGLLLAVAVLVVWALFAASRYHTEPVFLGRPPITRYGAIFFMSQFL